MNKRIMTPTELRKIGEKLYGARWQTEMAKALSVTARTIRYYSAGKVAIRPVMAKAIRDLLPKDYPLQQENYD
jgi:hypothetical protein